VQPVQSIAPPQVSNVFHRIGIARALFSNPNERLHCLPALVMTAEIDLANGFAYKFRHSSPAASRASMKGVPKIFVQV
jgi:hypothetical protein